MRAVCTSRSSDQSVFGRIRTTRFPRLAALALAACSSAAALAVPPVHVGTLAPAQPNQEERFGFAVDVRGDLAVVGAYGDSQEGQLFRGSASVYRLGNDGVWDSRIGYMSGGSSPRMALRSTSSGSR